MMKNPPAGTRPVGPKEKTYRPGDETGVQDEHEEEEVQPLPDWYSKTTDYLLRTSWSTSVPAVHETFQPWESARDVYSKRRIIAVTKVEIVRGMIYKHLDWITVRREDDQLYKFKEGDFTD
ncbi:hypothetical protein Tco_0058442 [Tanacetum coccineum]